MTASCTAARAIDSRGLASGVLQCIHLAVQDRASPLHAPVVAAANDAPAVNQHRADRDAAFACARLRFRNRRLHEFIGHVSNLTCASAQRARKPCCHYLAGATRAFSSSNQMWG